MPFSICLMLLLLGYIFNKKSWGKKLLLAGIVLLLFFSNSYLSNLLIYNWEPPTKDLSTLPVYELGIVLTGVTHIDKLPKDRTYFARGADRATHTVQLYKMGKIKKILISGGLGFNPVHPLSEAESLRDFMVWAGVDKSDIIVETKASNTRENAVFSEKIITSKEVGLIQSNQLLLITSAFHMKRATACFAKVGLHPDTFPVDFYGKIPRANLRSIIQPSIDSILIWHKLTKEWIGIAVYSLVGYI
ncbi:YdcF family protein [Cyclobacterium amurskyense]|nr:YdcF family protein [Cyclobacterium amurskyense]